MKKVCVLGLGYIGLPTALVLTDAHFSVIGFDVDTERVARLCAHDPVIQEPEVGERLLQALSSGRIIPTTTIQSADFYIIAVPTPFKDEKKADLSYVMDAAQRVASVLKAGETVIIESTIPVGATQQVADYLQAETGLNAGTDFFVAHCPERVLPGNIFHELVANDRIIGGINEVSTQAAKRLYKTFVKGDLYLTSAASAEMVKLVENSSRDVQIAFAHQVAAMAQSVGLDPYEVIELANKHPRVKLLRPSCGVGGHCIAVDPWFLVEGFPESTQLLKAARQINDSRPQEVLAAIRQRVDEWYQHNTGMCRIALFGATYKADVDDIRESPALHIIKNVYSWRDVTPIVIEPHLKTTKLESFIGISGVEHRDSAVLGHVDLMVLLVAHTAFKRIPFQKIDNKQVMDFCGLLHQAKQKSLDNEYQFWPANRADEQQFVSNDQQSCNNSKECT